MITLSGLGKQYGAQSLFSDVNLQFNPPNRYGLVGANGSGKSTLLRIIAGEEEPSSGSVAMPRRIRLGVLKQDHFRYENDKIVDVVLKGNPELWQAMADKEALLAASETSFDADRYSELEDIIIRHDGYSQEAKASEILEGLGIPTDHHHQPLSVLSGGFKLRVLLAQTLAASPDVLLLDEPTNHLDIVSIRWMEKFLSGFSGCVLVVSHDHRFLDNVCTHTVDIDYGTALLYPGNYSYFTTAKVDDRERRQKEIDKQEKKQAELQAFVDRFRAKATKARQAQSRVKIIEKLESEIGEAPHSSRRYPRFPFEQRRPSGKQVLELEGVGKSYGDKLVLDNVTLTVERGDRMAIIGPNGIGKSTLLKIIVGDLAPDRGRSTWGYEAHPGYFAQDHASVFNSSRADIQSWLWESCPGESIGFVRSRLGNVLFSGDEVTKRVGNLSGGEMARLLFCRLGIEQPNVLVLDEPTNHLDMEAIEALDHGLTKFEGTLLFVSHDRWFVSRLATRIVELTPSGLNDFRGTYDEYLERCGDDHLDAESVLLKAREEKRRLKELEARRPVGAEGQKELARTRKRLEKERDDLTQRVDEAESRVHAINELFCDPTFFTRTAAKEVRKLEQEQDQLRTKVGELMELWTKVEKELEELS